MDKIEYSEHISAALRPSSSLNTKVFVDNGGRPGAKVARVHRRADGTQPLNRCAMMP